MTRMSDTERFASKRSAVPRGKCENSHALRPRRVRRRDDVLGVAARRMNDEKIARPNERVVVSYNRALIFLYEGKFEDAQRELDRAASVEPNNPLLRSVRALIMYYTDRADEAEKLLTGVLDANPNLHGVRPTLAMCLSKQGKNEEARSQLTEAVQRNASVDPDIAYAVASVYAVEGDKRQAFEWLERSISLGNENKPWFGQDPNWELLRGEARFGELMKRIGR